MKEFFDLTLVHLGSINLKVSSIIVFIIFFIFIFLLLKIIRKLIYSIKSFDLAKKYTIYSLIKYFILVFACVIGLQILNFNISVLIAGSAALLVGIGLGLQNLFNDFISGIILLLDSTVKVHDVIEVEGLVCKVEEINLRTTKVLTRDDKYIILPNSDLTRNRLINWSHSKIASRFEISLGVDYSSDVSLVMKIMKETAIQQNGVLKEPVPFVRFSDYGESSLDFTLFFWAEELFRIENIKSEIRIKIFELFRENHVKIPFPQRDVHLAK